MDAGVAAAAELLAADVAIDREARRASTVDVDDDTLARVEQSLEEARGEIGSFFGVTFGPREGAGLIRYDAGGFYGPHRDRADSAAWPDAALRRIAVVLFLNSSRAAEPDGEFTGGILRLYAGDDAVDIDPVAGMVVAFPADTVHEVTVVRDGTRYAVVDWFY